MQLAKWMGAGFLTWRLYSLISLGEKIPRQTIDQVLNQDLDKTRLILSVRPGHGLRSIKRSEH